jgi:hypothetical protein
MDGAHDQRAIVGRRMIGLLRDIHVNIELDLHRNVLTFRLSGFDEPVTEWIELPGVIDIGERGRLLNLEIVPDAGDAIIVPLEDHADPLARTADVTLRCGVTAAGRLAIAQLPRRGPAYEITYPSGNQCWIGANGAVSCSVV